MSGRFRSLLPVAVIGLVVAIACGDDGGDPGVGGEGGSGGQSGSSGVSAAGSSGSSQDDTGANAPAGRGGGGAGSSASRAGTGAGGSGGIRAGAGGGAAAAGSGGGPSTACPNATLTPGESMKTLMYDGATRQYLVHVPSDYDGRTAVPLVIDLHGWTYDASDQAEMSGWREKSDAEGFIVAYPQGFDNSFNGGEVCCGTAQEEEVDDRGFVRAVVGQLRETACVDPKRVYVTGLSNGGALAFLLACRDADLFAAAAPVSMGNAGACQPARPISMIMFRGTADDLVPYGGDSSYPSAASDLEEWIGLNTCTGTSSDVRGVCERHAQCQGGAEVMLCTIANGRHLLYSDAAAAGVSVADLAWEAFTRHALP